MPKCLSCGADNPDNMNYCIVCGSPLARGRGTEFQGVQSQQVAYNTPLLPPASSNVLSRVFGGVGWLMVSVGMFLVAIGYLGVIDSAFADYSSDPLAEFRMIGYGMIVIAIGAIFFAVSRFSRYP